MYFIAYIHCTIESLQYPRGLGVFINLISYGKVKVVDNTVPLMLCLISLFMTVIYYGKYIQIL